jgi:hypothetical protein
LKSIDAFHLKVSALCKNELHKWSCHSKMTKTWTFTFGDAAENHHNMQVLGQMTDSGLSREEILVFCNKLDAEGFQVEFYDFGRESSACLMVLRGGLRKILDEYQEFMKETFSTRDIVDKKALMRGKVKNKHARWNLCYADSKV